MSSLVVQVFGVWRGADGRTAEVIYEGSRLSGPERWAEVRRLLAPKIEINTEMELDTGERIVLPTTEIAHLLPDRTGVLVLFRSNQEASNGSCFLEPDNAAIFNSDGSLRFQLKNPNGEESSFRAVVAMTLPDGSRGLGVRACPLSYPACESVYVVDGSTDDLSKQIPKWVRD